MSTRLMPNHNHSVLRTKIILTPVAALAVALIILGIRGITALDRSGFDDARGFPLIHKAGGYAGEGLAADATGGSSLTQDERAALEARLDGIVNNLWRRVRYQGETISDFSRADQANRAEVMAALLKETTDQNLKAAVAKADEALTLIRAGVTDTGEAAYKRLILTLSDAMPAEGAQSIRDVLAREELGAADSIARTARADSQVISEEAISERRLSRYSVSGFGVVRVACAMYDALMQVAPQADLSALHELLADVPEDMTALEGAYNAPARQAMPAVLDGLTEDNISGARLLAFAREMYAIFKATHPDIADYDHAPLLLLQAEAMGDESAALLTRQAEQLDATAWNAHLAPLLQKALAAAQPAAAPEDTLMFASIGAYLSGEEADSIRDGLAERLITARDADTGAIIASYLVSPE